ncbi:MAG: FkbM family methyltransferase [Verrucomicrobiota bacterium]
MLRFFKNIVNRTLGPFGYRFQKINKLRDPFLVQSHLVKTERPVIFDVGANVGDVSATYKSLFPSCTIHAFEPFPETFAKLNQRFGTDSSVKLNQVGVSQQEGIASMNANAFSATNSILQTDPAGAQIWGQGLLETVSTVEIKTVTLDAYCASQGISTIDILKLDIQGAELKALYGAKTMLKNGRVGLVYLEVILAPSYVAQPHLEDYLRFFKEIGFVMLDMFHPTRKDLRLLQSDVIFVPCRN